MSGFDEAEIAKFEAMAAEWWDPKGKFRPLHRLNPLRLDYICDQIILTFERPREGLRLLEGLEILDIGCGGGLVSEPMARLGARVMGVDASEKNIAVAHCHARQQGLDIDYRAMSAEQLVEDGVSFDVVLSLEVIEHVPDPQSFVTMIARLVRPGGLVILSTLNRTLQSFASAIIGAEWILRWLPRGTHDWRRFVSPQEMQGLLGRAGLEQTDIRGMVYHPLTGGWSLSERDQAVNYILAATPQAPDHLEMRAQDVTR